MAYTPNLGINSLDALIQLKMLEQMPDTEMVQAPVERPTLTPMPQSDGSPQGIAGLLTRYAESKLSGDQPIQMADGGSIMDSLSDRVLGNVDNNEYENNYDYSYEYTPYASRLSDVAEPEPMLSYSPQDAALSDLYSERGKVFSFRMCKAIRDSKTVFKQRNGLNSCKIPYSAQQIPRTTIGSHP